MIKKTSILPPMILQWFNEKLLSQHHSIIPTSIKLNDDEMTLWNIWLKIEKKVNKSKSKKVQQLKMELLEIYGRIQEKKQDPKRKIPNKTEETFYRIGCSSRCNESILAGFRYRPSMAYVIHFGHNETQKIYR